MSYSHLFIDDSITRNSEDKIGRFIYYRDSITYILANDGTLESEYALYRAIAMMVSFNFDDYALSIVGNKSIEETLPKTNEEKLDFLKHLAVMILVNSDICRTEDVIIFEAIAHKYDYSLNVLDDVIQQITSRIESKQQYHIDLKNQIISSYQSAKQANKEAFTKAYLAESEDYIELSNSPF